jgi:hypothetical protein
MMLMLKRSHFDPMSQLPAFLQSAATVSYDFKARKFFNDSLLSWHQR